MPVSKNKRKNGKVKKYKPSPKFKGSMPDTLPQLPVSEAHVMGQQQGGNVTIIPPAIGCGAGVHQDNS